MGTVQSSLFSAAIAVCVLATLYLGVLPGRVLDYAAQSAQHLMSRDTSVGRVLPPQ